MYFIYVKRERQMLTFTKILNKLKIIQSWTDIKLKQSCRRSILFKLNSLRN